jgi:hypothetical protein
MWFWSIATDFLNTPKIWGSTSKVIKSKQKIGQKSRIYSTTNNIIMNKNKECFIFNAKSGSGIKVLPM